MPLHSRLPLPGIPGLHGMPGLQRRGEMVNNNLIVMTGVSLRFPAGDLCSCSLVLLLPNRICPGCWKKPGRCKCE
jgi:hypothetical protein